MSTLLPVVLGILIGGTILYRVGSEQPKKQEPAKQVKGDQRIAKYMKALENSSVKDFQAMVKKIDDVEERKEVMRLLQVRLKPKNGFQAKQNIMDMDVEDQLLSTSESFVKGMLYMVMEGTIMIVAAVMICMYFGLIDINSFL